MSIPTRPRRDRILLSLFFLVDSGFVVYWLVTALKLLPPDWLYKDYTNPLLVAWNWSFVPLDLAVSATGYLALGLWRSGKPGWRGWAIASLSLTTASGLQAISFWTVRGDFDPWWWAPNLFLVAYPWFFLPRLVSSSERSSESLRVTFPEGLS